MKRIDLTGQRFGQLTALRHGKSNTYGKVAHSTWVCACDCGNESTVETEKLRRGTTQSCGCGRGEPVAPGRAVGSSVILEVGPRWISLRCKCGNKYRRTRCSLYRDDLNCGCEYVNPNSSHRMTGTREYFAWHNAKVRCHWPKHRSYKDYGGRGIQMCDEWRNSFEQFYADMGPCPDGYTIERIDLNGNYEASNCKWIPRAAQARNKRNTLRSGKLTIKEIAEQRGINYYTLRMALKRGEDPLTFVPRSH